MKAGKQMKARAREECSPRHVPDEIFAVPDIPYTLTGKKLEVSVKKSLSGTLPEQAATRARRPYQAASGGRRRK